MATVPGGTGDQKVPRLIQSSQRSADAVSASIHAQGARGAP